MISQRYKYTLNLLFMLIAASLFGSPQRTVISGEFSAGNSLDQNIRKDIRNNEDLRFSDTLYADINGDLLEDRIYILDGINIALLGPDSSYTYYTKLSDENGNIAIWDPNEDGVPDIVQQQGFGALQIYMNSSMPALQPQSITLLEDNMIRWPYPYDHDGMGAVRFSSFIDVPNIFIQSDSLGLTLMPRSNWNGTANLTITYQRGTLRDTVKMPVNVLAVNDAPYAMGVPPLRTVDEDMPLDLHIDSLLLLMEDPDGTDVLTITPLATKKNISYRDGILRYQAPANWSGKDSLQFVVSDGELSDTLLQYIQVNAVNDAPVWRAFAETKIPEDKLLSLPLKLLYNHVSDIETPDSLLRFQVHSGEHVHISTEGGRVTLVPDENWFGRDKLMLTVSDGDLSDTTYWRILITPVNDAPVLSDLPDLYFNEDDTLYIDRTELEQYASDIETETNRLNWQVTRFGKIRVFYNGASIRCIASQDWFGTDSVQLTVSDGDIAVTKTWKIHVLPVNDAPQLLTVPGRSFYEDDTLSISKAELYRYVSDAETPASLLQWTILGNTDLTIIEKPNAYQIFAKPNWYGHTSVRIVVSDGELTDTCRCRLRVVSVNDAPVIRQIPAQTWKEDDTLTLSRTYLQSFTSDIETNANELLWSFIPSAVMRVYEEKDQIKLVASPDWNGKTTVGMVIYDGGLRDTCILDVTITPVNDAPRWLALPDTSILEDGSLTLPMSYLRQFVTDPDIGDSIHVDFSADDNVYIEEKEDTLVIWPYENWFGTEKFTLTASDGIRTVKKIWTVPVHAVNDAPYFTMSLPDSLAFNANSTDTLIFDDIVYDIDNSIKDLVFDISPGRIVRYLIDDNINNARNEKDRKTGIIFFSENYKFGEDAITIRVSDGHDVIVYYMPVFIHDVDRFLIANPEKLTLLPNSPNPFRDYTDIRYSLPTSCYVNIKIYNLLGNEIKSLVDGYHEARNYSVRWYGESDAGGRSPSGVYLCRMSAIVDGEPIVMMHKMMLVR